MSQKLKHVHVLVSDYDGCRQYSFIDQFGRIWEKTYTHGRDNAEATEHWEVVGYLPTTEAEAAERVSAW